MKTTFEAELNKNGKLAFTNVGVSMLPIIREGKDVMLITKAETYRRYDVVLFRRENVSGRGEYVLHRILKARKDGSFWVVGDNCVNGEFVKKQNILGVLTKIKRGEKEIKTTDFSYKLYVAFWCAPYHFRFFVLKIKGFIKRVKGWLKRHVF